MRAQRRISYQNVGGYQSDVIGVMPETLRIILGILESVLQYANDVNLNQVHGPKQQISSHYKL